MIHLWEMNQPSVYKAQNNFYRIVDKNGKVQVIGTFDQCFDELVELSRKLPGWGWRLQHIKDGVLVDE